MSFDRTPLNTVKRLPERGRYDKETIYQILDSTFVCHVAFVQDNQPFIIPTLFARHEDEILLHGASTSRLLIHAAAGNALCIAVTLVDGIVLARSVFHHSINYRSAVVFGTGRLIDDPGAKLRAMEIFTEKLLPKRWADTRPPNPNEFKATAVIAVTIESASAKLRQAPPKDDEEDLALPHWAGVLPIIQTIGTPIPAPDLQEGILLPDYIAEYIQHYPSKTRP